jgi:Domain of unknown function (DUF1707)/AAA lid domain/ATPase family associated with various cellular activities (AAA)
VMAEPGDEETAAVGARGLVRATDIDREQAIDALKAAFARGELDKDELDGRVGQALTARTRAEVSALTADLPGERATAQPPRQPPRTQNQAPPVHVGRSAATVRPRPPVSVEEALSELDAMIGLTAVKDQVRSIAASIEAARRRAVAGITTKKPMWHFVFLGPPGTGKTTSARLLAKIFYAFGLLEMPEPIEAHGATVIRTDQLIDSALGGVLFIDGAYKLRPEAVQTLRKRAEDDRDHLIIILAGYEKQMEAFLASNSGLASWFAAWLKFPSYSPAEMLALVEAALDRRGERLDPAARPVLWRMFEEIGRRRIADELGNGRFVRNLLEKAGQARDVRVMTGTAEPDPEDLVTIRASDLGKAYAELTNLT